MGLCRVYLGAIYARFPSKPLTIRVPFFVMFSFLGDPKIKKKEEKMGTPGALSRGWSSRFCSTWPQPCSSVFTFNVSLLVGGEGLGFRQKGRQEEIEE